MKRFLIIIGAGLSFIVLSLGTMSSIWFFKISRKNLHLISENERLQKENKQYKDYYVKAEQLFDLIEDENESFFDTDQGEEYLVARKNIPWQGCKLPAYNKE